MKSQSTKTKQSSPHSNQESTQNIHRVEDRLNQFKVLMKVLKTPSKQQQKGGGIGLSWKRIP